MAKKTGLNQVVGKLKKKGVAKAHRAHKDDPVKLPGGGGDLPGGIEGGVAQLVQAEISEHDDGDNKGEPYAFFSGVVKEPVEHNGSKCRGRRASVFIPLYDTPGRKKATFEDHWADFLNELRKFDVDTSFNPDDVVTVLEELVEEEPFFKFRTWSGTASDKYPNPRVNTDFMGVEADYEDTEEDQVTDDTEEVAEEVEEAEEEGPDLSALGESADEEDEDAQTTLTELAEEHELDPDEYATWGELSDALAEAINSAEETEETEEAEETEVTEPEVGDVKIYDGADVEVVKVNKNKTADVQDIETEKVHKRIAWSELSDE